MKCLSCGHPPGRHQNLSTGSTQKTCTSRSSSTSFSIGPVCQYPGCGKPVYFDMNTSVEYPSCKDHSGIPLSVQPASLSPSDSGIFSPGSSSSSLGSFGGRFSSMLGGYFSRSSSQSSSVSAAPPHQSSSFPQVPPASLQPATPSIVSFNPPQQASK